MPKVSIIVLNWNNYGDTKECLESLAGLIYPNYEVIVVDNGSEDGSTRKLQKEFLQYVYIYNSSNLGFTGGNNVGIKYALDRGADYVFILNNDMIVEKDFLRPLVEVMQNKKTGIVGPATYRYPEKEKLYTAGQSRNYWTGGVKELKLTESREVESLGGAYLIRKEVIDAIGYFYEPYFLNLDETDYCFRARRAGFRVVCQPKSKIWHKVSVTMNKIPAAAAYYYYRNKLLFTRRNAPLYVKYPFYVYFSLYLIFKSTEKLVKGDRMLALAIRKALFDFWQGNFGKRNIIGTL